jgi:hypothetical protein
MHRSVLRNAGAGPPRGRTGRAPAPRLASRPKISPVPFAAALEPVAAAIRPVSATRNADGPELLDIGRT